MNSPSGDQLRGKAVAWLKEMPRFEFVSGRAATGSASAVEQQTIPRP